MQTTEQTEFTPAAFAILRHAVTLSRNEGYRTVAALRARLQQEHPGADADINAALLQWANYAAAGRTRNVHA